MTECLLYMAYRSFILQLPEFRRNFELIKEQFSLSPESFKLLSKNNLLRLKQMQVCFNTGKFSLFEGHIQAFSTVETIPGESDKKHKDLVEDIYRHRETTLIPHTGTIEEVCPEYPVLYGSLDLMVRSGLTATIVEVKTDEAKHDIVGQMIKYFISMSLKLNLKIFDEIKMITICPGYDQSAINGLKQIGALPLLLNSNMTVTAI